jgi:hypothetical protein
MTEYNRYNNGKIYKLVSNHTDNIYIGSTCKDRLCQRLARHKGNYKDWLKTGKNYTTSYELFKLGDVEIILLESVNCETKEQLLKKEREYIDRYKDINVNKAIPITTNEEKKEWNKQYFQKNKEKITVRTYEYRANNKEQDKQYHKKYYENNKVSILEKDKQKYVCECGSTIRIRIKARHIKTLKHQAYLNTLQQ